MKARHAEWRTPDKIPFVLLSRAKVEIYMGIKQPIKKFLGEENIGKLEYFLVPRLRNNWGGPFNGQKYRQRIFFDLLRHFRFKAIVETGTHRGYTTTMFAETLLPVYTAEIHPRYFSYSRMRFRWKGKNVHLYKSDSRSFLGGLYRDATVPKEGVFFYLDAHWGEDLPLRDELEIIFSNWKRPIVMVDDFQVPNSGYAFDDYGPGKALNLNYIKQVVAARELSIFFPAVNSTGETGGKRGSVVLCQETTGVEIEKSLNTLVRWKSGN